MSVCPSASLHQGNRKAISPPVFPETDMDCSLRAICVFGDEYVCLAMIYVRICVFGDEYVCLAMIYVRICVFGDEYVCLAMIYVGICVFGELSLRAITHTTPPDTRIRGPGSGPSYQDTINILW